MALASHHEFSSLPGPSYTPPDESIKPVETGKKRPRRPTQPVSSPDNDNGDGGDEDLEHEPKSRKKRARGRPRMDIKDVTAADRRRTQIRLAQRAYRNRKERTIVMLENKVQSLRDANEAMSNAFLRLHDFAVQRGLLESHPDLASQLRQTTEIFLEMARQSSADEGDEGNEGNEEEEDKDDGGNKHLPISSVAAAPDTFEKRQKSIADAVMTFGYQTLPPTLGWRETSADSSPPDALSQRLAVPSLPPITRQTQTPMYGGLLFYQPPHLSDATGVTALSDGMASVPNNGTGSSGSAVSLSPGSGVHDFDFSTHLHMTDSPMSPLLPCTSFTTTPASTSDIAPYLADTHAFLSTAAIGSPTTLPLPDRYPVDIPLRLRLRRLALQCAYALINLPDPPPDIFARVFGFCSMFERVDQIRQRLRQGLEMPIDSSSSTGRLWELPYVSQAPGPEPDHALRNSSSDYRGSDLRPAVPLFNITLPGFEGTFLDCEDIEMYLHQRGVDIPLNTNNAIVEVDDADFVVDGSETDGDGRGSGSASVSDGNETATAWGLGSGTTTTITTETDVGHSIPINILEEATMMATMMGMPQFVPAQEQSQTPLFPKKRLLSLDIDRFMQELVERGSCLGQTLGLRQSDINRAFWRSAQAI